MAQFRKLRNNCAKLTSNGANTAMSTTSDILNSIRASEHGLTLAELLAAHSDVARRTAQRVIAKLIGKVGLVALFG